MSSNIEIIATYKGALQQFDNPTGAVVVGQFLPEGPDAISEVKKAEADEGMYFQGKGKCGGDGGSGDDDRLEMGRTYRLFGKWGKYHNQRRGTVVKQFRFSDFVEHTPQSKAALVDYLASHGKNKRIGPAKARTLVEKFGVDDVLTSCRTNPGAVADITGIEIHQAESFAASLQASQATENTILELSEILNKRGFPKAVVKKLVKQYKNSAPAVIREDPYVLMNFRGVGFAKADKLWIDLGKDVRDIHRQTMCLWSILNGSRDGHIWHRAEKVVNKFRGMVPGETDPRAAIVRGKEIASKNETSFGAIATIRTAGNDGPITADGETLWLGLDSLSRDERQIAVHLATAKRETKTDVMTTYSEEEEIHHVYLKHATCTRCQRHLTAPDVFVLNGKPFGPTCIKKIPDGSSAKSMALKDWIEQNPRVDRFIRERPDGVIRVKEALLWPDPSTLVEISEHQRTALDEATSERVGLLIGSPGTGKTTSIASLVKSMLQSGHIGIHQIAMAAPTGKASVRMTQSLAEKGLRIPCRTWHSLLGTSKDSSSESDGWSFMHGLYNPWDYKVIIGDEDSMLDTSMKRCILDARAFGAHMLFVGDTNQLAPVGPGAPLRDMIAGNISTGELTEIHRNSGGIVKACKRIKDGERWAHEFVDNWESNLTVTDDRTDQDKIDRVLSLVNDEIGNGIDPVWDIQVLIAVNEKSELSRTKMNALLQESCNHNSGVKGTRFKLDDKVVCLKNNEYLQADSNNTVYVANGEVGIVREIDERSRVMLIELKWPKRVVRVFFGSDRTQGGKVEPGTSDWDLGYAFTPHKFQGSECSKVFTMLDSYRGARSVCDRSWMTTSLSRAIDHQIVVGTADMAEQFCRKLRINDRKTFLRERLIIANLNTELAGL